jgi:hypothetical protein
VITNDCYSCFSADDGLRLGPALRAYSSLQSLLSEAF